ncbi:hypothetical protein [Micavibrio aeruginosavorus]|uniref:hypothetical protein n=1 Tax=Micavibrio aeruginosavorus TaxID=349221 RepID=UPI003F4A9D0A
MSLSDEIRKISNLVDYQIAGSPGFEFFIKGSPAIQLARQLNDIADRVRILESHIVPEHLTTLPPQPTEKVIRLDLWKAKQPERKRQ